MVQTPPSVQVDITPIAVLVRLDSVYDSYKEDVTPIADVFVTSSRLSGFVICDKISSVIYYYRELMYS